MVEYETASIKGAVSFFCYLTNFNNWGGKTDSFIYIALANL